MIRLTTLAPGLLIALLLAAPAAAQPRHDQLREAEQSRREELAAQREAAQRATAARTDAQKLAAQQTQILSRLRDAEQATTVAATRIEALAERRRMAETRLAVRAADITPLLPLIERLALFPTETLLAVPVPPEQAVRGALVLGGLVRTLEHEAQALRAEQAEIARLQAEMDAAFPRLAEAQAAQAQAAEALDEQLRTTRAEGRAAEDEATRRTTYQHAGRFDFAQRPALDDRANAQPSGQFRYTLNKDGALSKRPGDALPTAEFTDLLTQVEANLRRLGEAIFAGEVTVAPVRLSASEKACDRCDYRPICRFDPWTHPYRTLPKPGARTPTSAAHPLAPDA